MTIKNTKTAITQINGPYQEIFISGQQSALTLNIVLAARGTGTHTPVTYYPGLNTSL